MSSVIRGDDGFDSAAVGKVLQVVSSTFASNYSHNNAAFQDIGQSVSITPKSATSILYLEWAGNVNTNGLNGMSVAFREGSVSIGGGASADSCAFYYNADGSNNTHNNQSMLTSTASTGTVIRTFKISTKVTHSSGTSTCNIQGSWGPCVLKVTEVAQ